MNPISTLASKASFGDVERACHETALKWFEIHADQRMAMFRFFITLFGLSVAAYASQLGNDVKALRSILGVFICSVAICFKLLDQRSAQLIKISESAIAVLYENYSVQGIAKLNLVSLGEQKNGVASYRQIFSVIFWFCGITGFLLALLPWITP